MPDWETHRLGEIIEIRHGFAFKGEFFTEALGPIVVTPGNFHDEGGFKPKEPEKYHCGEIPEGFVLMEGDLLVVMTEQKRGLLGSAGLIPSGATYLHNQRLGKVVELAPDRVSRRFLYYLFNTRMVREQIQATANGAKVRHTSPSRIRDVLVSLPPISTQRKIAAVLSAYDELIESNLRRVEILEEMAQAVYREWFVNFHHPDLEAAGLSDSPLGPIPRGWDVLRLGQVLSTLESGSRPRGGIDPAETGVPSVGAENILGLGRYDYTSEKFVSRQFFDSMRRGHVRSGDVLLYKDGANLGRKSLFRDGFPHAECCINEHVFLLRTNGAVSQAYLYFWLDLPANTRRLVDLNSNAAQPGISQPKVFGLPILVPPIDLVARFDQAVEPMLGLLFNLALHNAGLRSARDLLLPRLVSGELDVSDLDIDTDWLVS